ncbi:MAG: acyltransferase [Prevotellaceae bacterium]|nr:acyltransferase [Prevotellaceae bacterium]
MIKQIVRNVRGVKNSFKEFFVRRNFKKCATLIGTGHKFYSSAGILLSWGSTKEDVVLHDHCEIYGGLISINKGKIIIHDWVKVGFDCSITSVNHIEIGKDTAIASGVTIIDNNTHPICPADRRYMRHTPHGSSERSNHHSANAPIIIGENVWIGSNVRICKGVTIGDNAIIAANSIVTKNVPANAIAAGNPAKIVKENIDQTTTPIFPLKK